MPISLSLYVEPERLLPSKILLSGSSLASPLLSTALILPLLGICFATARNVSRITTSFVHASMSVIGTFLDLIHIFVGLIRLFLSLVDLAVAIICLAVSLIRSVLSCCTSFSGPCTEIFR
ncbi:hypothetical protein BC826DRAFT_741585 [Russula brevipes]|nr:hypothetical protein BC826DRAFT_741585 [Russula brevipes]